jgi:uncharacterized protein YbjT (DUF2867 family)
MGATGNIGSKLANILLDKGEKVKVIGRSAERLKPFVDHGAEAAVGDVSDVGFLTNAFKSANAVFALIPPAYTAKDFRGYYNEIGANIVKSIQESGVKHVVFLSSHGAHLSEKTGPVKGLYDVEQQLNHLADVNILHLRPTNFMENLLANIGMIKNMGMNGGGVKGDIKISMIATKDIASVAAEHLLKRDFSRKAVHELLGERDVSMEEVTKVFGKKIGKPDLRYVQFSPEEEKKGLRDFGLSDDASDQLVELSQAMNDSLIAVNIPRTAKNTTGTSIEEFADFFAQVYKKS